MNPLRCCVIDDEPLAGQLIASYVQKTPTLELQGVYTSASDAVCHILDGKIDLVFLDIEMPQLNGLEFAKVIPPSCKIIFTTAYDRYATQGYKVNAIDYLLKPINYNEFLQAVNRTIAVLNGTFSPNGQKSAKEFLLVKSEYRLIQIRISDIQVIEGLKDYIKLHIAGQSKPVLTLMSMKSIEQVLPTSFMRVHRSYIVNTKRISIIERNNIIIGDHLVPVSESYRQQFNDYIASLNPDN